MRWIYCSTLSGWWPPGAGERLGPQRPIAGQVLSPTARTTVNKESFVPQEDADIIVYGTTWCPDCVRAKSFLDQQGVPYKWVNIEEDEAAIELVLEKNGGCRVVPTVLFPDDSVLVEPSNRELAQRLGLG